MTADYARELGSRLRAIRTQQGLSLQGVEEKSRGEWKAVVIGSYERGDRAVTVQKLARLAEFYGVPIGELLPGNRLSGAATPPPARLIFDIEKLGRLLDPETKPLARFCAAIQTQRGDYNGKVLTMRTDDLRTLAVIYDQPAGIIAERFVEWGVLDADALRGLARDAKDRRRRPRDD